MRTMPWCQGALAFILFVAVPPLAGEELVLKDGRKITGTIVGFENGMFRVETEFGFALVRKDRLASVNLLLGGAKPGEQDRDQPKDKTPGAAPSARSTEKTSASGAIEGAARVTAAEAVITPPKPVPAKPVPPPPSHPLDEPLPEHLRDHVEGSSYINDTFQFAMFKPLGWKIFEDVPKEAGYGIVAMGTEDERTVLIVNRQVWSGPPDLKSDRVEEKLRQTYGEFQRISESAGQIDGSPARRRVFKGVLDGVEWHGVMVQLARGNAMFGIVGLTSAEMLDFQQAVLNKIINSFHFLTPASATGPAASGAGKP